MSMREGWRSVLTRSGEPFAVGQVYTAAGELQMEELSVNNWDTNWLDLNVVSYAVTRIVNFYNT